MALDALNIPYDFHKIDLMKGETRTPSFLRLNPQHTIPVMKDGDVVLNDSTAIMMYLAHSDDKLYPQDKKTRARVNNMLLFDMDTF